MPCYSSFRGMEIKMKKMMVAVIALSLITGCATIVSESIYPVTISSTPVEADFTITNSNGIKIHSGRTPSTVTLASGDGYFSSASYRVTFKKKGFSEKTTAITAQIDGWYIGNFVFGGLIGLLVIDPITGAMWKLPKITAVSLDKNISSNLNLKELKIVSIDNLLYEDRAKLIPIK